MARVPLQTAPSVELAQGSAVQFSGGPGVDPVKDVVSDDIKRMGKAQQAFGQAINKLDDELNEAEGKRLANDYYAEVEATKNEYLNLKGVNAVGTVEVDGEQITVFEQYQRKLKGIYESYGEKASNGTVKYIFDNKASVYTKAGLNDMTAHTIREQRNYSISETTQELNNSLNAAKVHYESWNNPDGLFRQNYVLGLQRIDELAKLNGWNTDPNAIDPTDPEGKRKLGISNQYLAKIEEYNMEIAKAVIKKLKDKGDFDGAKKFEQWLNPEGKSKELNVVKGEIKNDGIENANSKCVDSIISNNGNQNDGSFSSQVDATLCLSSNQVFETGKGGSVIDGENSDEVDTTDKTQSENINSLDQRRSTSIFFSSESSLKGTLIPEHQTTHLFAIQKLGVKKADSLYQKAKSSIEIDKERFKNDPEYAIEINKQIIGNYNKLIIEASVEKYGNKEVARLTNEINKLENTPNLYTPRGATKLGLGPIPGTKEYERMQQDKDKNKKLIELKAELDKAKADDPKYVEKIANDLKIITNGIDYNYGSEESTIKIDPITGLQPLQVLKAKLKATITNPKELETALKDLEFKYNKIKTEREAVYNQALEKAIDIVFNPEGNGVKDLKAHGIDINDFTKEDQERLRNGPPEESDIETVANLDANVDEVVNNLNAYRFKLSPTQYLQFKQYAEGLKGNESKYVEATGDNTLFKDTLYKNGYKWVYGELKDKNAATFHSIKTEWIDRIDYVQTHVEKRKLTREEKLRLLNNVLLDKVNVGGFGGRRDISMGEIINPDKLKQTWVHVDVEQEDKTFKRERIYGSDIKPLVQSAIMAYLYRNKKAMSQQRIAEIWVKFGRPISVEQFKENVEAATLSLSTR